MEVIDQQEDQAFMPVYAGFWERFGAIFLDGLLLMGVNYILYMAFGIGNFETNTNGFEYSSDDVWGTLIALVYFVGMEGSKYQGTLGKIAVGIKVTDLYGQPIGPGKAFVRYIGRILSAITLLIGYLMQPFTPKKQALHDLIAGTLVTRK